MASMEQHEYGHDLAVQHPARAVAVTLARHLEGMFLFLWSGIANNRFNAARFWDRKAVIA